MCVSRADRRHWQAPLVNPDLGIDFAIVFLMTDTQVDGSDWSIEPGDENGQHFAMIWAENPESITSRKHAQIVTH